MDLDVIFAWIIGALAGLAVIGALAFALVWEWTAIRARLAKHRKPTPEETFWRQHQAVTVPERPRIGGGLRRW